MYFSAMRGAISPPRGCGFSGVWKADQVSHSSAGRGWTIPAVEELQLMD